jgi:CBS domain-containing protein
MTQSVIVAAQDDRLADAVVRMDDARVDRLPVVDRDGRPVGILAREDVVRAVSRAVRTAAVVPGERRTIVVPD